MRGSVSNWWKGGGEDRVRFFDQNFKEVPGLNSVADVWNKIIPDPNDIGNAAPAFDTSTFGNICAVQGAPADVLAAQVHGGDRRARLGEQVDDVPDPLDVLEAELRGVVEVDARLRGAVDDQLVPARVPAVALDRGHHAVAQEDGVRARHLRETRAVGSAGGFAVEHRSPSPRPGSRPRVDTEPANSYARPLRSYADPCRDSPDKGSGIGPSLAFILRSANPACRESCTSPPLRGPHRPGTS